MSGGHFDYKNHVIFDIAESLQKIIDNNSIPNEYGYCNNFNKDTLAKFEWLAKNLELVNALTHRADWLLSGDDGEEDFAKHWAKDGGPIVYANNSNDLYDFNFIALNPPLPDGWPPDTKPYDEQLVKDGKLK